MLKSGCCGCEVFLLDLSRFGETKISTTEEEETGIAGRELGEGKAGEDKCKVGDDIEAWRMEGVIKLVNPAARTLS